MAMGSSVDTGTSFRGNRFPHLRDRTILDCEYGIGYPVFGRFCLPHDIWRITAGAFVRFQPMLAPTLTRNIGRLRFFYVNLRQIMPDIEEIITGSKDGFFNESYLTAKTRDIFEEYDRVWNITSTTYVVEKGSFADIFFEIPPGTYDAVNVRGKKGSPAAYWYYAYIKIYWDYYRDENLSMPGFEGDFETAAKDLFRHIFSAPNSGMGDYSGLFSVALRKDYFMSALPWQLKGIAPTIQFAATNFTGSAVWSHPSFVRHNSTPGTVRDYLQVFGVNPNSVASEPFELRGGDDSATLAATDRMNASLKAMLNNNTVNISGALQGGFNAADFRAMMAQTRVFERMARTGSRYTEYLRANFGTSPADETLQRPVYLGGMKFDVAVTEIEQTAQDGNNPVGTLRGHGIANSANRIHSFMSKEFGVILGILDFSVDNQYTQGVRREYTYKSRTDFFNPSFQHISEQEVRNSEVYFGNDDKNDETFGFQPYAQELRRGKTKIVGDMRDTLSYWQQGIVFSSRPALNRFFISAAGKWQSYRKPFAVQDFDYKPMIVDCSFVSDVYRPMSRYGTPGLVDHY